MEKKILDITNELFKIREEIEDFNVIYFDTLISLLSEVNNNLKKIADSLELISHN